MKVYVASALTQAQRVVKIEQRISQLRYKIIYSWASGYLACGGNEDDNLSLQIAQAESDAVKGADLVFGLMPCGRGSCHELGIAVGMNKKIILLNDVEEKPISLMRLPYIETYTDEEEAIKAVMDYGLRHYTDS